MSDTKQAPTFNDLWKHQQRAVELARSKQHLALFMDVGVGKTAATIFILREEYQRHLALKNTLIFAPIAVCEQWKREFARFSKIDADSIHVLTGTGAKRTETLRALLIKKQPCIIITNYEAVQIKAFYAQLLKWSPDIIVFDEAQKLKSSTSVRAKLIYPLAAAARRRFILTGTPILNSMLDIFGQFKALDPTIFGSNFFEFKRKYFYDVNAGMPRHLHFPNWQPLPTTAKRLGEIIGSVSIQARKAECLDLPPLLKIPIHVELSSEQRRTYDSMAKEFVAEMQGSIVAADFSMVKTLRLQQILAGYIIPTQVDATPVWCKDNPRLDALSELLTTIGAQKTIIWSVFQPTYSVIAKRCEELGRTVAFLTGEQTVPEKTTAIESFCRGNINTLISHPSCGGVGVNLIESKFSIYYTRGYSLEQYVQSEGRNFRGGSNIHDKISHYHLIATDTLDEVIAKALLNKQNVAQCVLNWAQSHG